MQETTATVNQDALDFLGQADKEGSIPVFISKRLRHIAISNGIDITPDHTAMDVFGALKDKATKAGQWGQPTKEQVEAEAKGAQEPTLQAESQAQTTSTLQPENQIDYKNPQQVNLTGKVKNFFSRAQNATYKIVEQVSGKSEIPDGLVQDVKSPQQDALPKGMMRNDMGQLAQANHAHGQHERPKTSSTYKPLNEAEKKELVANVMAQIEKDKLNFGGATMSATSPITVGPDGVAHIPKSRTQGQSPPGR